MLKAVILTLNEERHIAACIDSLRWTDGIVVLDSFSSDKTAELAQKAGAEIIQHRFENYSQQRNVALENVDSEWIFFLDADERATPALGDEIRHVIAHQDKAGWWVPRHNYIFGHRMRGAGWWPDHQLRLLHRDRAHYDPNRAVHEEAILDGEAGYLTQPFIHYNYETLQQFIAKQRKYTDFDAAILLQKGVRPKFYTPYTQIPRHFWWRFVTLGGWRDGLHGILLSGLMSYYEMRKYQRVRKIQQVAIRN
jgi:hypothetical protein